MADPAPLPFDAPIVDVATGWPSPFFLDQWNAQRTVNVTIDGVTIDLTALTLQVNTNTTNITNNTNDIATINGVGVAGGAGLTGSGTIGSNNLNVELDDTAVTAGSYTNTDLTVDAQGRITSAANGSGGGGGGANWSWPNNMRLAANERSSTAYAFKGFWYEPLVETTFTSIVAQLTLVNGATYRAAVYRIDGSNMIDQITGVSSDQTYTGSSGDGYLTFTLSAVCAVGSAYFVGIGRTDSTDNYVLPLGKRNVSGLECPRQGLPFTPFVANTTNAAAQARIAQATPAIGDTVNQFNTGNQFLMGFLFTL